MIPEIQINAIRTVATISKLPNSARISGACLFKPNIRKNGAAISRATMPVVSVNHLGDRGFSSAVPPMFINKTQQQHAAAGSE
jgi:hypothetical protein